MRNEISRYVDRKLLIYVMLILVFSLGLSFIPVIAPFIIVALVLGLNAVLFKGGIFTLYLAFVFLDSYSLVWGGDLLFVFLPEETIDITFTSAAGYIGLILVFWVVIVQRRFISRLNSLDAFIILFFLLMLFSPITGAFSPEQPIKMIPRVVQFFTLYLLTRMIVRSAIDIHRFFQFTLVSFVPIFSVILIQYLSGYFGTGYGKGRPGDLVQFIPYLLAFSALLKSRKVLIIITIPLTMLLATFHGSRRFFIEMLGYLGLHFKFNRVTLILVGVFILCGPLLIELVPETTRVRLESTFESLNEIKEGNTSDEVLDNLGTGRWSLLLAGLDMWSEAPIFGIGLKNNMEYMAEYGGKERKARIHNYYAEVLVDLGIVGLFILSSLMVVGFRVLKKVENVQFRSGSFLSLMTRAYRYQFVMLHVVAFFGHSMFGAKSAWVTYALIGSFSSLASSYNNQPQILTRIKSPLI